MRRTVLGALFVTVVLAAVPVAAHHNGTAKYDPNKPITFTGKVTKVEWMNPHIYYYVDVTDAGGKVTNYAIEGAPPGGLYRAGVKKDSLKVGDTITVSGFLARKEGLNHVNGRNVTFADGRKVFVGAQDGLPENTTRP
jgi:hypothetical protein